MPRLAETDATCPMDSILRTLMGPWTTYIIWLLHSVGPLRFGELKARMPAISSKMLTERLRHLEASGLVHRDYRASIPPRVTYSLTERGHALKSALGELDAVARRWAEEDAPRTAEAGSAHPYQRASA